MWTKALFIFCLYITFQYVNCADDDSSEARCEPSADSKLLVGDMVFCEYVIKVLDHYKQPNPVGLPGLKIPEPYHVPEIRKVLGIVGSIIFKNTTLYGISKFRILYVNVDVNNMQGTAALAIDKLEAYGNYSLTTWFKAYAGNYTASVQGIKAVGLIKLDVKEDGQLTARNISIDLGFKDIDVQFENSGILALTLEGLFKSLGTFLFDTIKPHILKDMHIKIIEEFNKNLDDVAGLIKFPNSISPIDNVYIHLRKKIAQMHKDPILVDDYYSSVSIFNVGLTGTRFTGLSTLHRVGNTTLKVENHTALVDLDVSTQRLKGTSNFEISSLRGMMSRSGTVSFTINYIRIRIVIGQPLDTRKKPEFRDMDVNIGNMQVGVDGLGSIDYVSEFAVNILPNLLRNQIMDAFEEPLRLKIQRELDEIDVEELIIMSLPRIFELESLFKSSEPGDEKYDDDEFFNF